MKQYPVTPDGRYFAVRGRLWRLSNPQLSEAERSSLVSELMDARRAVKDARREGKRGNSSVRCLNEDGPTRCGRSTLRSLLTHSGVTGEIALRDAGLRIHILLSPDLAPRLKKAGVDRKTRGQVNASDHAPAWIVLD